MRVRVDLKKVWAPGGTTDDQQEPSVDHGPDRSVVPRPTGWLRADPPNRFRHVRRCVQGEWVSESVNWTEPQRRVRSWLTNRQNATKIFHFLSVMEVMSAAAAVCCSLAVILHIWRACRLFWERNVAVPSSVWGRKLSKPQLAEAEVFIRTGPAIDNDCSKWIIKRVACHMSHFILQIFDIGLSLS